jgi:succinate dehydrogenase / fumarate reductase, membrane anchor subunit
MAEKHPGSRHWLAQRLTALALAPLGFWFLVAMAGQAGRSHDAVARWIGEPVTALALAALLGIGLWHALQGIEAVLIDYLHDRRARALSLAALRLVALSLAALGAWALFSLAIGFA